MMSSKGLKKAVRTGDLVEVSFVNTALAHRVSNRYGSLAFRCITGVFLGTTAGGFMLFFENRAINIAWVLVTEGRIMSSLYEAKG